MTNTNAPVIEQRDRDAAADFFQSYLARPGEVPVEAAMRMGHIDESPIIQAFAKHRIEALAHRTPDIAGLVARLTKFADFWRAQAQFPGEVSAFEDAATALSSHGAVVAQIVAWLREQADNCLNNGLATDETRYLRKAAIHIERGDYRTTPVEPDPDAGERP